MLLRYIKITLESIHKIDIKSQWRIERVIPDQQILVYFVVNEIKQNNLQKREHYKYIENKTIIIIESSRNLITFITADVIYPNLFFCNSLVVHEYCRLKIILCNKSIMFRYRKLYLRFFFYTKVWSYLHDKLTDFNVFLNWDLLV